jgi:pyruvate formate lyase activating enzyme
MSELQETLGCLTAPGKLYQAAANERLECLACAHRCKIASGQRGICQVRIHQNGELRVPHGYVAGMQADPIEKKPFAHFLPGSDALTFGMLGCNLQCDFCQNWLTSQALRDPLAHIPQHYIEEISADEIVRIAESHGADIIASSYNEPLISSEWSKDIFELATKKGIQCVYVSNGFATPEVLEFLQPVLKGFKVDLKTMQEKHYKECGGRLQPVLDSIIKAHELGMWVEVVTLVIPEYNDSNDELWEAARFITSVSHDIPWHVTAFHPDYKHLDAPATSAAILQRVADIGQEAGLHYVYAGNLPGRVGSLEDTICPQCTTRLIQRRGFALLDYQVTAEGKCPKCGYAIAGVWTKDPSSVQLHGFGLPRRI